jgi:hypothetical protein
MASWDCCWAAAAVVGAVAGSGAEAGAGGEAAAAATGDRACGVARDAAALASALVVRVVRVLSMLASLRCCWQGVGRRPAGRGWLSRVRPCARERFACRVGKQTVRYTIPLPTRACDDPFCC